MTIYPDAKLAIAQALRAHTAPLSRDAIDRIVFYNLANRDRLRAVLKAMEADGVIVQPRRHRYALTDSGKAWLQAA